MLQELLRAESLQAEESQLTFRPSINQHYQISGPRLKLSNPGPYLAHVQARAAKRRESLLCAQLAAEVGTSALMGRELYVLMFIHVFLVPSSPAS